jgi:hypothetical protein
MMRRATPLLDPRSFFRNSIDGPVQLTMPVLLGIHGQVHR